MMLQRALRQAAMIALASVAVPASADEPGGAAAPIGTSERRVFFALSLGTACADARDAQSCLFVVRAGIDLIGAELHVGALVGGAPQVPVGGLQLGGEWGTPYFKLTRRRAAESSHVLFMAIRNSVDFDLIGLGRRGFSNFVFSHRFGPAFAFGLSRRLRLFGRLGVGFSLVSTTDSRLGSVQPIGLDFTVDCAVGVQLFR